MSKNPLWKQPTPMMQLRAILASAEGHSSIHESGIISDHQFIDVSKLHINELMNLLPYVEKGSWKDG
jgi:hypothetical protein